MEKCTSVHKRGIRNESAYVKNEIKIARIEGEEYTNYILHRAPSKINN